MITVIFQQVTNISIDNDHHYDNDLIRNKNLKVFTVKSSGFPYLYLDYNENKGLLKKYYLKVGVYASTFFLFCL